MKLVRECCLLLGDMQGLDAALEARSRSCHPAWTVVDGLVSTCRGIAQVVFINNPLSGAFILTGLMCSNVLTGAAALVSVITAIFVSKVLDQPRGAVRAGLTSFSACLVGTVTLELMPLLYHKPAGVTLFLWVILMSALSVPVGVGLGNILGTFNLPAFTLPFNTVTSVLFLCLTTSSAPSVTEAGPAANATLSDIHWDKVMLGSVYSMGQVYASYTLLGSILMYAGCLLCSPILSVVSFLGALIGTLLGVVFSAGSYDLVYNGVWGYNGILAAEALLFFMVPSARALLLALLNAVLATMIQAALAASMGKSIVDGLTSVQESTLASSCATVSRQTQKFVLSGAVGAARALAIAIGLPVFTFPFVISTLLMLAVTSEGDGLRRVKELRYPELHLRERPQHQLRQAGTHQGPNDNKLGDPERGTDCCIGEDMDTEPGSVQLTES